MIKEAIDSLVNSIACDHSVKAIGLSSNPIPQKSSDGDIDLFVYCSEIPAVDFRIMLYPPALKENGSLKTRVMVSKYWGDVDFLLINGIDTWIMYFTESDVTQDYTSIIEGRQYKRENGYYPTGRLAMFKNIQILHEKDCFLTNIKDILSAYPPKLKAAILKRTLALLDEDEDLLRAVNRRDVLFFHVSIDNAIDNLLQLIYVMNEVLFPSRKRVQEITRNFHFIPQSFYERLCEIVKLGSDAISLSTAYEKYKVLRQEVKEIYNTHCV